MPELADEDVLRLSTLTVGPIRRLFQPHGLALECVADAEAIPGSHWGDEEAGLIRDCLYVRSDTPVHSALHEGCHWLLMSEDRRARLHTDAGGSQMEENAVCYLQVLLADRLPAVGRDRMFSDMDRWGYSFRRGSARAWFHEDAEDVVAWIRCERPQFADWLTV